MTDAQGRFEFRTIRPGTYPDGGAPAHIHLIFTTSCCGRQASEMVFDDDPLITKDVPRSPRAVEHLRVRAALGEAGRLAGGRLHDQAEAGRELLSSSSSELRWRRSAVISSAQARRGGSIRSISPCRAARSSSAAASYGAGLDEQADRPFELWRRRGDGRVSPAVPPSISRSVRRHGVSVVSDDLGQHPITGKVRRGGRMPRQRVSSSAAPAPARPPSIPSTAASGSSASVSVRTRPCPCGTPSRSLGIA